MPTYYGKDPEVERATHWYQSRFLGRPFKLPISRPTKGILFGYHEIEFDSKEYTFHRMMK